MGNLTRCTLVTAIVLLTTFWLVFFYGLAPYFGIEGDDIFILSSQLNSFSHWDGKGYLDLARARQFLIISLITFYHVVWDSVVLMQNVFFVVWLANGVLCYLMIRCFAGHSAALLASALFLAYAGKYEVVPILSGGMYHIVITILLVCLIVGFSSTLTWRWKSIIISLLYWASLHFYEILMPIVPLLPVLYWMRIRRSEKEFAWSDFAWTLLPGVITLIHIIVLGTSENPIWNRSGHLVEMGVLGALPNVLFQSLSESIGVRHFGVVKDNLWSVFYLEKIGGYRSIVVGTFLLAAVSLAMAALAWRADIRTESTHSERKLNYLWGLAPFLGLYLIVIAPLISLPVAIGAGFVPSRFTYVPSVGISIIAGWLLSLGGRTKILAWIGIVALVVVEAVTLRMILFQYNSTASYDSKLLAQLNQYQLSPAPGCTFFLSLPENELMYRVWKQAPAKAESGALQSLLLMKYPSMFFSDDSFQLRLRLIYEHYVRRADEKGDNYLLTLISKPTFDSKNNYAFKLDHNGKLCGISNVEIVDNNKRVIGKKPVSLFPPEAKGCISSLRIPQAAISDPWISEPRQLNVYHGINNNLGSDFILRISGRKFPNDPSVTAYLSSSGKILGQRTISDSGDFVWDIKLGSVPGKEFSKFELGNAKANAGSKRLIWRVESVEVIDQQGKSPH